MSFPLPKNQRIIKQYPDIGAGIATGYPERQVVGDQVVGAGRDDENKKPYPVNPHPMQGSGDNPSIQPVMPKLQPFTPSPEQSQEGIDQQELLTDRSRYGESIVGPKLKEPMAERVMNALRRADEALYTTTPNGLQEQADITQVGQVPELDHSKHGSTIFLDPSFDGSRDNDIRNIGEHFDMVDRMLKQAGAVEKQKLAGVSRYSFPIIDDQVEVKATDNTGVLHVIFEDRIGQVKADITSFNALKQYLETWYVPRQIYARNLKAKRIAGRKV
jgi:hypothetical protein